MILPKGRLKLYHFGRERGGGFSLNSRWAFLSSLPLWLSRHLNVPQRFEARLIGCLCIKRRIRTAAVIKTCNIAIYFCSGLMPQAIFSHGLIWMLLELSAPLWIANCQKHAEIAFLMCAVQFIDGQSQALERPPQLFFL
jgi:hypothetical protein